MHLPAHHDLFTSGPPGWHWPVGLHQPELIQALGGFGDGKWSKVQIFFFKNTQHWLEMKGQGGKEFIFPTATESLLSLLKPTKPLYEWWWGHGSRREMASVSVFSEPSTQMRRHGGIWPTKGKVIWIYVTPSRCGVLPTRRSIHSLSQEPIPLGY